MVLLYGCNYVFYSQFVVLKTTQLKLFTPSDTAYPAACTPQVVWSPPCSPPAWWAWPAPPDWTPERVAPPSSPASYWTPRQHRPGLQRSGLLPGCHREKCIVFISINILRNCYLFAQNPMIPYLFHALFKFLTYLHP